MRYFLVLLYVFLVFFILTCVSRNIKKYRTPNAFIGVFSGCLLYYGLVPLFIWISQDFYISNSANWKYFDIQKFIFNSSISLSDVLFPIFSLVVGLLFFIFSYNQIKKKQSDEIFKRSIDHDFNGFLKKIAYFLFVLGGFSILLYVSAFGGFANAMKLADKLRQHDSEISQYGISGIYSYFLLISGVLTIVPFMFYSLWKSKRKKHFLLLTFISFALCYFYLMLNNGKSPILRLIVTIFFMFLYNGKINHKYIIIIISAIVAVPILDVLDSLFVGEDALLALKSFSFYDSVTSFACPTYLNYNINGLVNEYGYMYFIHFVTDFISILPGIDFKSSYVNTSEFISGPNWATAGGVPNDLLTYGLLQFPILGVIAVFSVWGFVSGWLDSKIQKIADAETRNLFGIMVCMNLFSTVSCADIEDIVLYNLSFVVIFFVFTFMKKRSVYVETKS